jgi:hypothetical protein
MNIPFFGNRPMCRKVVIFLVLHLLLIPQGVCLCVTTAAPQRDTAQSSHDQHGTAPCCHDEPCDHPEDGDEPRPDPPHRCPGHDPHAPSCPIAQPPRLAAAAGSILWLALLAGDATLPVLLPFDPDEVRGPAEALPEVSPPGPPLFVLLCALLI